MERQIHGFEYERLIMERNNLTKESSYTGKWDMYELFNGKNTPVSVKCIGFKSSIDFGDFKRQTEIVDDFILYIGFWKGQKRNIVEEYKVLIKNENWIKYFGDKNIISDMVCEMSFISNDYSDDCKWKEFRNKYSGLYGKSVISLRFKRDHKSQKRIQCGITKSNFLNVVLKENLVL
jgi:hypothetical protein